MFLDLSKGKEIASFLLFSILVYRYCSHTKIIFHGQRSACMAQNDSMLLMASPGANVAVPTGGAGLISMPSLGPNLVASTSVAAAPPRRLVGYLQSRKIKKAATFGSPWQTHFWIADVDRRSIEFFKHDQALKAKGAMDARDIESVQVSSDKSNKFFHLIIALRSGKARELRMRSREQRDEWLSGVLEMMRSLRSDDRLQSMTALLRHRLRDWRKELGVKAVDANVEQLADIPPVYYPAVIEGLEKGVDLVRGLLQQSGSSLRARDFDTVRLNVWRVEPTSPRLQEPAAETSFDPIAKQLIVGVLMTGEPLSARFALIDAAEAAAMLSSTLWRDPSFEGWTTTDRSAKQELEAISRLLGFSSHDGDFRISIHWSPGCDQSSDAVQRYVLDFINAKLLADVHQVIVSVMESQRSAATASSTSTAALGVDPLLPRNSSGLLLGSVESDSTANCLRRGIVGVSVKIDPHCVKHRYHPTVAVQHRTWAPEDESALNSALAILAPLRRTPSWGGSGAVTAGSFASQSSVALSAALEGLASPDDASKRRRDNMFVDLTNQLVDIVQVVRVADACRSAESRLSTVLPVSGGVTVAWSTLPNSILYVLAVESVTEAGGWTTESSTDRRGGGDDDLVRIVSCPIAPTPQQLPELIGRAANVLVDRYARLASSLLAVGLLPTLQACVRSFKVFFSPHPHAVASAAAPDDPATGASTGVIGGSAASALTPLFERGAFSECFLLSVLSPAPPLGSSVVNMTSSRHSPSRIGRNRSAGGAVPLANNESSSLEASATNTGVVLVRCQDPNATAPVDVAGSFGMSHLDVWFRGVFSVPANIALATAAKDEDDGVDEQHADEDDDDEYDYADEVGEAVAAVRTTEARVLSMTDIVNMIYDSQGADPEMKVEAEGIRTGLDALVAAFPKSKLSRHDLLRVGTVTLKKCRVMFSVFSNSPNPANVSSSSGLSSSTTAQVAVAGGEDDDGASQSSQAAAMPSSASQLRLDAALHLLREYCEFQASEAYIPEAELRQISTRDDRRGHVSFRDVARAILCHLMPAEAVLAMRSRRDVLIVGLENVGKTLIVQHLKGNFAAPTFPTMGASTQMATFATWVIGFHEVGGRHEQRTNWRHFTELCDELHGVVVVLDAARDDVTDELYSYVKDVLKHRKLQWAPMLVLLNNSRVDDCMTPEYVEEALGLPRLCSASRKYRVESCDVTMPQNRAVSWDPGLTNGMQWLCAEMDDLLQQKPVAPKP